jgi:GNAT superfamily N-acetyltransferase
MSEIIRILNINDLNNVANDLMDLFEKEDDEQGHHFLKHNIGTMKAALSNPKLLQWDFFIWAHKKENKYDAVIAFCNEKNIKFGVSIFNEFIWLSKNHKIGFKLFKEATSFAREKGFKYIMMSSVDKNPKHQKVVNFYKKIGFKKDTETYIAKL